MYNMQGQIPVAVFVWALGEAEIRAAVGAVGMAFSIQGQEYPRV